MLKTLFFIIKKRVIKTLYLFFKEGIENGQNLDTVFRCCSLGFLYKMISCRFLLIKWKCIF